MPKKFEAAIQNFGTDVCRGLHADWNKKDI